MCMHAKFQVCISNGSKVMAKVKVLGQTDRQTDKQTNKQTDRQTKNNMPPSIDRGHKKGHNSLKIQTTVICLDKMVY